jgi:hypothetical protein
MNVDWIVEGLKGWSVGAEYLDGVLTRQQLNDLPIKPFHLSPNFV